MKKNLCCLVNPAYYCINCKKVHCINCQRSINLMDKCPDRPLYGNSNGHYYLPIDKRPLLVINTGAVKKIKIK